MSLRPRHGIEKLEACVHGGIDHAELKGMGIDPAAVLDFSVCTNPFMPPPDTGKALGNIAINQYPDSGANELRQRLAERLRVSVDNIIVGSGTTELIRLIALAYFERGDRALILAPTYGDYELACQIAGAETIKQWGREEDDFVPEIREATSTIKQCRPRGVFICNPNKPTGKYLPRRQVETVLEAIGDSGVLVLDEAYLAFVEEAWPSINLISQGNVVILRSMTKDYGLAGLRLGYALASREIIDCLRRVCPPWNVNVIAQKMGVIALDSAGYLDETKKKIRAAKQFLTDGLSRLGLTPLPSDANFFLVEVGNAPAFRAALLKHGILVRDCTSFGLPEYVRLAPRTLPECRKLINAIRSVRQEGVWT